MDRSTVSARERDAAMLAWPGPLRERHDAVWNCYEAGLVNSPGAVNVW